MSWQPRLQVFDERAFKDNLTAYLRSNQTDALFWANGNASGLKPIANFFKSSRLATKFPALWILQTSHSSRFSGDFLTVELSAVIEIALQHGKQDELADMSPKYAMAFESMLANVPNTTFSENSYIDVVVSDVAMETVYDVMGEIPKKTQFIQVLQTAVTWEITAAALTE